MMSPRSQIRYGGRCRSAQPAASTPSDASTIQRMRAERSAGNDKLTRLSITDLLGLDDGLGPTRGERRDRDEGEEPRKIEVEPVREDQLEADEERGGQR